MSWKTGLSALTMVVCAAASAQDIPAAANTQGTPVDVPGLRRRGPEMPLLKSEVRLVTLDVAVTDLKGNTVKGLKPEDFILREDGSTQKLASFEEHAQPDGNEAAAMQARLRLPRNTFSDARPPTESSAIVLLLDALDSPAVQNQMYLREQMIDYMKKVRPGTRIAILQLDTQLHMLQDFSSDPEELLAAVKSKRDKPKVSPMPPVFREPQPLGMGTAGGISTLSLMNQPNLSEQVRSQQRNQILAQAMPELMRYMAGLPGRKSLVWFYSQTQPTGAYSLSMQAMFHADQTSFVDAMSKTTDELRMSHIALTMVNVAGPGRILIDNFRMAEMVEQQGGEMVFGDNDIEKVIEHVADKAWNFYTLSYTPPNSNFDGKFRKVVVEVAGHPGYKLQYRPGYYANSDEVQRRQHQATVQTSNTRAGQAAVQESTIESAMLMGAPMRHDVLFTAHVDPAPELEKLKGKEPLPAGNFLDAKFRKDKFREYRIDYSVDPHTLWFHTGPGGSYVGNLEVVAVVYDDRGMMVNSLRSDASVHTNPGAFEDLEKSGVQVEQRIAIPAKGNFFVRLGVHDRMANKVGVLEVAADEIELKAP